MLIIDIYSSGCCVRTWEFKKKRGKKNKKERTKETNKDGKKTTRLRSHSATESETSQHLAYENSNNVLN